MSFDELLALATLIIWSAALYFLCYSLHIYPEKQHRERFWLMMVIASFVIHVIVFYICRIFIFPPQAGVTRYGDWSVILRIHGGLAILLKEIVTIARIKKYAE